MHYSVRKKDIVKSVIQDLEHCTHTVYPAQSKKLGRNIDQSILIVDMEGKICYSSNKLSGQMWNHVYGLF